MRIVPGVVLEALLVAAIGSGIALIANAVSPRGLSLTRNYFPGVTPTSQGATMPTAAAPTPQSGGQGAATPAPAAPVAPADPVLRRLEQRGLHVARHEDVVAWFRDPHYDQGLFVFVDARDDGPYQAGHIPGAWQFHHYRPERHLAEVLPASLTAIKVVVYCGGGDCEDSEFAAVLLRDAGVPRENLFVYPGGIREWTTHNLPLEKGARRSGQIVGGRP